MFAAVPDGLKFSDWIGWVVGFVTASVAPIIVKWLADKLKRPKLSAAIFGAEFVNQSGGQGWRVRVAIKNDGDAGDTLVAAHLWIDEGDKHDASNYAMHEDGTSNLSAWSFADPALVHPDSVQVLNLRFWKTWQNPPNGLELAFQSGNRIVIDIGNNPMASTHFQDSFAAKAWVAVHGANGQLLKPHWFECVTICCHCFEGFKSSFTRGRET